MTKKLLLLVAVFTTTIMFGQTEPINTWVDRPADNAELVIGTAYTVSADYNAGQNADGSILYEVGNASDLNMLEYSIQLYTDDPANP